MVDEEDDHRPAPRNKDVILIFEQMKGKGWMAVVEQYKSRFGLDATISDLTAYSRLKSVVSKLGSLRGSAKELFLSKQFHHRGRHQRLAKTQI